MTIVVTRPVHFRTHAHGRRIATTKQTPLATLPSARVPRVARLMALALRFDRMLREGEVRTVSELARRYQVSQPRMTQILNLTLLAPSLQERLLFASDGATISEHELRGVLSEAAWALQFGMDCVQHLMKPRDSVLPRGYGA